MRMFCFVWLLVCFWWLPVCWIRTATSAMQRTSGAMMMGRILFRCCYCCWTGRGYSIHLLVKGVIELNYSAEHWHTQIPTKKDLAQRQKRRWVWEKEEKDTYNDMHFSVFINTYIRVFHLQTICKQIADKRLCVCVCVWMNCCSIASLLKTMCVRMTKICAHTQGEKSDFKCNKWGYTCCSCKEKH